MMRRQTAATRNRTGRAARRTRLAAALSATVAILGGMLVVGAPLLIAEPAQAVFAEGGEGNYRTSIDWFSFGEEGPIVPQNGKIEYVNNREIGEHTLSTTCTISNIVDHKPIPGTQTLSTYRSGWYQGDGLSMLYNIGGSGWGNQLVNGISNTNTGAQVEFRIDCGAEMIDKTRQTRTPVTLQGLVVADAESSNEATGEYIEVAPLTGAGAPSLDATWRVIDRYRPAACDTSIYATVDAATNGMRFQPKGNECIQLPGTDPGRGPGPMAMGFMEGATSADVTLKGGGSSAVAIGMVIDTDFGDAPASYGEAGAIFYPTWAGGEIARGSGSYVSGEDFELGTPGAPARMLGSRIDSEVAHQPSWDALLDDESPEGSESDEDALDVNNPPQLDYSPGVTNQMEVACTVVAGQQGFVAGWIDWERTGSFENSDRSDTVECVGGKATLTWTTPAGTEPPTDQTRTFLRLRIAADTAELLPTGMSNTGEVEDYALDSPLVTAVKTSDPVQGTVLNPGDEVTYTLTFKNESEKAGPILYSDDLSLVLDNATLTAGPTVTGPAGVTAEINGEQIDVTGMLAKDEVASVSYTVTVNDDATHGDRLTNHLLLSDGEGGLVETPPGVCLPENPRCTDHPIAVAELEVTKFADPPSSEPVNEGQRITYQVLFHNWGAAPKTIDWSDELADVLDDADWGDSLTMRGDLDAAFDPASEAISVTGELGPGDYSAMRYSVIVKDTADRGNNHLANFVVEAGETPPAECAVATKLCTEHPVLSADVSATKSSNPASGETVIAGQELTYELNFTNDGAAGGAVSYVDDLTAVLDDADFVAGSIEAPAGWTVTGPTDGKLSIEGALAADGTATVSYRVKVKAEGGSGDGTLANFILEEGVDPPDECLPEAEDCTTHPVGDPKLVVSKSANPESGTVVAAGDELTYSLTFDNSAGGAPATVAHVDDVSGVLDDAEFVEVLDAGGLTVAGPTGDQLSVTGTVAAGEVATVTYTVRVKADGERGDNVLANFLLEEGVDPPSECLPEDEDCTTHPVAELVVTKSADPASGEAVAEGDELTYTLTFDNRGGAPVAVDFTDDLTGVLDDAEVIAGPTVMPAGSLVGEIADGRLALSGEVPAATKAVVSYTVRVLPDGGRGDNQLTNFLLEGDAEPPAECAVGSELCTTHPVPLPDLKVSKLVDPASGTAVAAGDELSYTLRFDNSSGAAPAKIAHVDDLSGVLDDAEFGEVADADGLTVSGPTDDRLSVAGTVAAGAVSEVTYTVRVKADGERVDNSLANFLFEEGEDPPTVCDEGDEGCTTNPVPELTVSKSADPASGKPVQTGDVLSYTLTFDNTKGKAPATVNHRDDLSDVLDDASFVDGSLAAEVGLTATGPSGDAIAVTGEVPAGTKLTVSYRVTVNDETARGNNVLANFLVADGEDPPTTCEPGEPCTTHPAAQVVYEKSVDAPSSVVPGSILNYTITVTNTGDAEGTVARIDDLSDVLDDADMVAAPASDTASATVAGPTGEKLTIGGSLAAGATAKITYEVKVKEFVDQGNHQAVNFLLAPGAEPPAVCDPAQGPCTSTPWPYLEPNKTASPDSGTVLRAGDEVTYSLHFINRGTAPAQVNYIDHAEGVFDDAELVTAPSVEGGPLAVSGPSAAPEQIAVTGELASGEQATVTYTVRVADDVVGGERLTNFLKHADDDSSIGVCDPETLMCTDHPIVAPGVDVQKTSQPGTGKAVEDGEIVTYALRFWNWSPTAAEIAYEDLLADVLDDAVMVGEPTISSGDGSGVAVEYRDGGSGSAPLVSVTGEIEPEQEFVVTYQVRVDLSLGGNKHLGNFVVADGGTPPTECEPGDWHCTVHPAGKLVVDKQVDPVSGTAVAAGQALNYTLTFTNEGAAPVKLRHTDALERVLDDAVWDDTLAVEPAAEGVSADYDAPNEKIHVAGELAAGATVTVKYSVTVKPDGERGDNELGNFLLEGNPPAPPVCDPANGDICTTNPVPNLVLHKSSDPASGTAVAAGDVLSYTLTFDNRAGKAAAGVAHADDLADVLDDAVFVVDSLVAEDGLAVTGPESGKLAIEGSVPAGELRTVTYKVTVKPDADRLEQGNNSLANFLFAGDETPEVCAPGEPCTVHPVPNLQLRKSVDPESTTVVAAGDELSYTLTFDNSAGTAAAPVNHADDLSDVLDDASYVAGSLDAADGLNAAGPADGRILVTGEVPAGETLTVSYRVTVLADGARGNSVLANYLLAPGVTDPPATCEPGDQACTTNPVKPGPPPVVPKPPLEETGGTTPWPWVFGGAGLLLAGGIVLAVRRRQGA